VLIDHLYHVTALNVHLKSNIKLKGVNKLLLIRNIMQLLPSEDDFTAWNQITAALVGIYDDSLFFQCENRIIFTKLNVPCSSKVFKHKEILTNIKKYKLNLIY
jgi:hypothetical protein